MANTRRSPSRTLARSATVVVFTLLACNSVLGIEDARVDPTLGIGETSGGAGGGSGQAMGGTVGGETAGNTGGSAGKSSNGGTASVTTGGSVSEVGGAGQGGEDTAVAGGAANGGEPGTTGGVGQAGAGGAPPAVSICEQYCDTITKFCTGTSLQYKDREQCLAVCELFPRGVVGDLDGNHIACRLKYAGKARYAGGTELNAYCRQAGPGGDGRCGSNCDGLCAVTMATCSAEATPPYFFASDPACHTTCASLPDIPYVYGDITVADGNSVQCRLFHAISAAMMDPEEHCAHVMGLTLCEQ